MGCGTYRVHSLFNSSAVWTSDPENIRTVLATGFRDFELGPVRRNNFVPVLGHGIFTSEGGDWAYFRAQLRPQFTREQEMDIMPLLFNFTLDVSTEFLFGKSVNSQTALVSSQCLDSGPEVKKNKDFSKALNFALEYIGWRVRLQGLYWVANSRKFRRACRTVRSFTDDFVRLALDPTTKKLIPDPDKTGKFVLLDSLIATTKSSEELRDQVLQILVAGRDTTSSLLSWTILLLSRHPKHLNFLRNAILEHFGTESSSKNAMTFSSLKACKPVQNVLYEALRLYPLVPVNSRTALVDTILPVGGGMDGKLPIAVAKGEQVVYSAYVLHRRNDIWGEDADEFRPGRWEGRRMGWEFLGFSGGPRVCLGQQYALNEAGFVLSRLLQRYDGIQSQDISKPLKKNLTTILSPGGVKVKLHKADS
ncbi:cytochrome P450 [Hyaloscypha variabilis F]|uniref:Cytochrome P450 n=1 Tax=Hyaloscypha variabilis (strain UAMH 11265 / GT02V1 / F) TaxID=1149755 RepID=A0A2J6S4X8_HYAVF|nr:cytochrome P450 [Hyaloscypha variabilis F]